MNIRRYLQLFENLNEAPIDNFELIGDFNKGSSFRKEQDRKLLMNPKAVQKIKTKWQNVEQHFNLYFINSTEAGRHKEIGEVDETWLKTNLPNTYPLLNLRADAVNVLFTNNSATPHEPMTAWMIAHRLGHVLSRYSTNFRGRQMQEFTELRDIIFNHTSILLKDYNLNIPDSERTFNNAYTRGDYSSRAKNEKILKYFYQAIGTMRSAREGEIRDEFEFTHELLAQYIISGTNKFNQLPRSFKAGKLGTYTFRGDKVDYEECNQLLQQTFVNDLAYCFDNLLNSAEGKIFVM